jgi:hypothetical protein
MNEKVSALLSGELKAMRPFFIRSTLLFSLVSGVWNYGLDWRLFLHDVHRAGSKSVYYLFDMSKWKPIPGSGTVRESKGFVHYHLAGSQISYDILKVPLASTSRYQIRMRTYEDIHGGRSLQDYLDQTPGAVAAAGANYISAYAHLSAPDSSPHAPAGLVVSQGRVRHAFDSFLTTYPGAGEGIVGLSKTGELLFLRSPRESSQTTALIAQLQEAAQVGPRLIWPDQNGTAQIARGLTAWFPNEIGFIMEDGKGNLYLGIEQAPLTGMLQPKTHLDVAKQIMSWSNAVGADIRYALAVEAGGYKALGTQGLFNPDLHINHAFPASSHVSLLMIVDTQPKELKIRGSDHRTHRREKGSA